jgi:hypothetical protein
MMNKEEKLFALEIIRRCEQAIERRFDRYFETTLDFRLGTEDAKMQLHRMHNKLFSKLLLR